MTNYELAKQFKAMGIKSGTIELEGNKSVTIEGNKFSFTEVIDLDDLDVIQDAKPVGVLEPTKVEPVEEPPEEDIEDPEPVSDSDGESSIPDDFFGGDDGNDNESDTDVSSNEHVVSHRTLVSAQTERPS